MEQVEKILAGDVRTAAKLIRDIDDDIPSSREVLKALYPHTGKAYVIGISGFPGVGKSTLVDQMIQAYREAGKSLGVLAVDPTSPFSGGAILGDRVRMQRHGTDPEVFMQGWCRTPSPYSSYWEKVVNDIAFRTLCRFISSIPLIKSEYSSILFTTSLRYTSGINPDLYLPLWI